MKTINYTGNSKLIARIVDLLNHKAPMPLDGNGDNDWGTNGQVLTTDGSGSTSWTTPSGGSSGHVIQDNGTDMTARAKLDFVGATVTDDAVNDATVVEFNGKTYTMTISGHTITLTDSDGNDQSVTVPDDNTTYSLSISGTTLTLTDSDGNHDDVTLPDNNTTYTISVSGTTVTLTGSDGTTQTITTQDTTYSDATQSTAGLMSASDKTKLDGIASGAEVNRTIWNRIKTALTKRSNLWFADASVSDVSADDATKVEVVTELASENAFDALATDGTADGVYTFPDSGAEYLTADNVGYGSGTVKDALDGIDIPNVAYKNIDNRFSATQHIDNESGTTSAIGVTNLIIGNNKASGTDKNSRGQLFLYGNGSHYTLLRGSNASDTREIELPNKSGTIALTSDLADVQTYTVNDLNFKRNNRVVSVYGELSGMNSGDTITYGVTDSILKPVNALVLGCLYSASKPYTPIGTVWISKASGTITIYKPSATTSGYVFFTYLCNP